MNSAATKPECPYCGATECLRVKSDGGGVEAPEYTCEGCFRAADDGPCFDDLPPITSVGITREGQPDELTVLPKYVERKLSWIDGLDAHEGPISTQNIQDLIGIARQFAKGYFEHASILKFVIADRERIRGERNDANAEAARLDGGSAPPNAMFNNVMGMSLRDWFAGQALNGICAGLCASPEENGDTRGGANHRLNFTAAAHDAYALADAMLAARA